MRTCYISLEDVDRHYNDHCHYPNLRKKKMRRKSQGKKNLNTSRCFVPFFFFFLNLKLISLLFFSLSSFFLRVLVLLSRFITKQEKFLYCLPSSFSTSLVCFLLFFSFLLSQWFCRLHVAIYIYLHLYFSFFFVCVLLRRSILKTESTFSCFQFFLQRISQASAIFNSFHVRCV